MQFVPDVRQKPLPRFDPVLGTLLSLLQQREHDLELLGMARFNVDAVKAALANSLPKLIYADISAVCGDIARRTMQYIQEHEFLPIVAGGEFATVAPERALSLPGVEAAAIGEPDASLMTYFERIKDPAIGQVVQGVWLRDERGLARPKMPALIEDLDSLPFPERDLFGYTEYVARTGEIEIAVGRGCPQVCRYCMNDTVRSLYQPGAGWVRRRSADNVLEEIAALRERYSGVRLVRFLDHAFALNPSWLAPFLDAYKRACDLPFRCHLRANALGQNEAEQLKEAGCRMADIEVISSSNLIRDEIFDMRVEAEDLERTFRLLREAKIRTRAVMYFGSPYESEASLERAVGLLRKLQPDTVDARAYYPFPGTQAVQTCRENGWLHSRGDEQYHNDSAGIDIPACRPEIVAAFVKRIRGEFAGTLSEPWWRRWSNASRTALGVWMPKKPDR